MITELTLPEFAFVEGSGHDGDQLKGRNVILHVRSASVVEVLPKENYLGGVDGVLRYAFTHLNIYGVAEDMVILLHYSATLDKDMDKQLIIDEVMKPASKWYSDYCDWEDSL